MVAYRKGGRRRVVVILLLITSLALITLDSRGGGGGLVGSIRSISRDALSPAQNAVEDITKPVSEWWSGTTSAGRIERENKRLKRELGIARGRVAAGRAARRENRLLRENQSLTFAPGIPSVAAEVIAASPGNFEDTIAINRGAKDGVAIGMPVVSGEGVIGRISGVASSRSTIRLITDPDSGIGVRFSITNTFAVAQGRSGSNLMRVDFVAPDTTVKKGELIVTSGLQNAAYPSGLPVGKVASVNRLAANLDQTIYAVPLVDMRQIEFVRVLLWTGTGSAG